MRGDGIIERIPAQGVTPKGAGVLPLEVRRGGLLNRGEDGGRCGGPQLSQARGALVLILAAQVLVRLRTPALLARALYRG